MTVPTGASVDDFLAALPDARRRADAERLRDLLGELTGEPPVMWGPSIVGFGTSRLVYANGRSADWPRAAFAPRKDQLVVYLAGDYAQRDAALLDRLGPHKTGKACLYLKRLDAVDESVLRELITRSLPPATE